MRTIAVVNQKGGCGKTTTAINLAALYAKRGLRTLLVDMDPQSHCAAGLGVPESRIEYSIGNALLADLSNGFDPSSLIWEVARNLHLAPSTVMLTALEAPGGGLHQLPDKDRRLENLLAQMSDHYDRCLIDCPPTIGLLTFNALRAAKESLIPVETGFFSLRGAEKQWNTIQRMISHIGRPIACHLLPTLHNPQSQLACNILAALRRQFAGQIMPVIIHEDEALREAASFGQPVLEYAPESQARRDFDALADWLEEHAARPGVQIEIMALSQDSPLATRDSNSVPASSEYPAAPHDSSSGRAGGGGGRAAELARRVHSFAARAAAIRLATSTIEDVAPADDPNVIDASSRTQTIAAPMAASEAASPTAAATAAMQTTLTPRAAIAIELEAEPGPAPQTVDVTHLFGVRQTGAGVLFIQPGHIARTVSIVGDFNYWSDAANPMRFNADLGVFEALIQLPPGLHHYRLVADGEWVADQFNTRLQPNTYGEPNNVILVT